VHIDQPQILTPSDVR